MDLVTAIYELTEKFPKSLFNNSIFCYDSIISATNHSGLVSVCSTYASSPLIVFARNYEISRRKRVIEQALSQKSMGLLLR
ncbi:MAG: hypothetical protein Q8R30_02885 [bacterium]|nr:hypothetical protein [bacterium]